MDSARSRWGRTLLLSGAAAATAGLFYLGTGLHPMPWLTWLQCYARRPAPRPPGAARGQT
jgi:hypothetical protein